MFLDLCLALNQTIKLLLHCPKQIGARLWINILKKYFYDKFTIGINECLAMLENLTFRF
ncbi:hypothetical protein DSUL_50384 [Desulfovibrionales bacterium]